MTYLNENVIMRPIALYNDYTLIKCYFRNQLGVTVHPVNTCDLPLPLPSCSLLLFLLFFFNFTLLVGLTFLPFLLT